MSLINDVLKNLEERQASDADGERSALAGLTPAERTPRLSGRWPWLAGAAAMIVGASAAGLLLRPSPPLLEPLSELAPAAPAALERWNEPEPLRPAATSWLARPAPPAVGAGGETAAPSQLEKVDIEPGSAHTRLTFHLSRETSYRLSREAGDQELHVVLSDTELVAELPGLELRDTPIQAIGASSTAGNLTLRLELKQPVQARDSLLSEAGSTRLVLDLYAPAAASEEPRAELAQPPPPLPDRLGERSPLAGGLAELPSALERTLRLEAPPAAPAPAPELAEPPTPEPPAAPPVIEKKVRPETSDERADRLYDAALRLAASGRRLEAAERYRSALKTFPGHRAAREQLALLLVKLNRSAEATEVLREGLRQDPTYTTFAKLQARILTDRNALEGALEVLRAAAPAVAEDPEYHAFVAALYQRKGEHTLAVSLYRQVLKHAPDASVWWMGLGISLEAEERTTAALEAFGRSAQLGNLDPETLRYVNRRIRALRNKL